MKARVHRKWALLGLAAAVLAGAPAQAETGPATLLTIDQYLLRADFAGEVLVLGWACGLVPGASADLARVARRKARRAA